MHHLGWLIVLTALSFLAVNNTQLPSFAFAIMFFLTYDFGSGSLSLSPNFNRARKHGITIKKFVGLLGQKKG